MLGQPRNGSASGIRFADRGTIFLRLRALVAASHTVLVLLEHGCTVTLIDNYSNSFPRVFEHMKKLAGDKASKMKFVEVRTEG